MATPQSDISSTTSPTTDSRGAEEAVGIAAYDYATKVGNLIKLVTDLRAIGAQTDIDLPRIAVIGNQSAGKSSLVEAISGISVPRSSGTCTRCPMECRMSQADVFWKAQVLLRLEKDAKGNKMSEIREKKFGPTIFDKASLEQMLRRAQLAILNPSSPMEQFETIDTDGPIDPTELQFSPNVVCVDISGPGVTNLSFIDLPGLISTVGKGEDPGNIKLIENTVREHISGNALILLTITMRDDVQNQGAAQIARDVDPKGLRTIGVLTKPDLIQKGEEDMWLKMLQGRDAGHHLHHGYFVTKQPAPSELAEKMNHSEARQREHKFFASTAPWNDLPNATRARVGVANLTHELSRLLSQLIEDLLPKLRSDVQAQLTRAHKSLRDMPPPPSENPSAELLQLITSFTSDLNSFIKGSETFEGLLQECRPAYKQFRIDIASTTPAFLPYDDPAVRPYDSANSDMDIEDSDVESMSGKASERGPIYLNEVRQYVEKSLTRQLPYNLPFSAKVGLIEQCFDDWPTHMSQCFDSVRLAVSKHVNQLVIFHFARFLHGGLKDQVTMVVDNQMQEAADETKRRLAWLMELETPPFTLNDHYFTSYREKYLTKYKKLRMGKAREFDEKDAISALTELSNLGFTGLKADDLHRLREVDPYEQEMIIMAEVRAYFQVAYKRIIDNVPRVIDYDFLRTMGKDMQKALIEGLGLGSAEASQRAAAFLSEEQHLTIERETLLQTKRRLQEIKDRLIRFHI